jgi:hypothetical protein
LDIRKNRLTRRQRLTIYVWAFAMLWLYIGNIINFHQHQIWGKQLLPVACTSVRSKGKTIGENGSKTYTLVNDISGADDVTILSGLHLPIPHEVIITQGRPQSSSLISAACGRLHLLRASSAA